MSLVTVAQIKVYLPHVLAASTSEDPALTAFIARAEAAIARYCGYPPVTVGTAPTLDSSAYTRYLDGPGGTELVIDFASLIPERADCQEPYILGSTYAGTNSNDPLHPDPPNPDLSIARGDVYDFGKPISTLEGIVTNGVDGYLTRFYTSTMISYVKVFRRRIICNANGTMNYISEEVVDSFTLGKG